MTEFLDSFSEEVWDTTHRYHTDNTVDDMFMRVAKGIAEAEEESVREKWTNIFYDMLCDFKGMAGGRILANAGTDYAGTTLMNCYVGPDSGKDPDSIEGILQRLFYQVKTLKSEGGWGENFSYLRPRGTHIHGIGVDTPGAVRYMELFNVSSAIITDGSGKKPSIKNGKKKIRKGAMMGVLDCWHPDIIEFITVKNTQGKLDKFNNSVNFTDEYMEKLISYYQAIEDGDEELAAELDNWDLIFPDTRDELYDTRWNGNINEWRDLNGKINTHNTIKLTTIWDMVMESTYKRNDPGVLFLDRAQYFYPAYYANVIKATNPCGEQTLPPGGVCLLGSINLTQFIRIREDGTVYFDYEAFKAIIPDMVRFLDDINDISKVPLDAYQEFIEQYRRIGLGIAGWGSALYMLKTRFASNEADEIRDNIMAMLARGAYEASIDLAIEKGMFPMCDPIKHAEGAFVKGLGLSEEYMTKLRTTGIRNSSLLSIQPNGNTSIEANMISGGNEPVFSREYIRTAIVNQVPDHLVDKVPRYWEGDYSETDMFKETQEGDDKILRGVDENGIVFKVDTNRGLTKEVECMDYGVRWLKERDEWDPTAEWAIAATELTAEEHLKDLKGFARWIDSAISKTINVPNEYPFDDFKNIYLDAYKSGYIKGVTTYRLGTMMSVLSEKEDESTTEEEVIFDNVKLPSSCPAEFKVLRAEGKKWYLTITRLPDTERPFALFAHTNSREPTSVTELVVSHLIDLAKAKQIPEEHIERTVKKMGADNNVTKVCRSISLLLRHGVLIKNIVLALDKDEDGYVGTFSFAIKKFLSSYIKDGEKVEDVVCEECGGSNVEYREGCFICIDCGNSKCG
ncbi:MAG: adenosylcobalamin-dependent ribonucleoside-diphosphate reductase [Candidatus Peribacteraceae bacterium]|nr:adenosylcobalamin-dependent ribonucleoside-diphosphate reductase [Candidatus Peribacteraceae bacterium]